MHYETLIAKEFPNRPSPLLIKFRAYRGRREYSTLLLRPWSTSTHQRRHHITQRVRLLCFRRGQIKEQLSDLVQNLRDVTFVITSLETRQEGI
jgi:hypothetical protein